MLYGMDDKRGYKIFQQGKIELENDSLTCENLMCHFRRIPGSDFTRTLDALYSDGR